MVFADRDCPYAHRIIAMLEHLGVAHDRHEVPIGQKPEGLHRWSPSGRIPVLVVGDVALGESRVVLEYLAEAHGYAGAFSGDLVQRTLEKHAMALVDGHVAPLLFRGGPIAEARLAECLDLIADATRRAPREGVLAFHAAPVWQRFAWWRPESHVTLAVRARPHLHAWLEASVSLPAVVRTAVPRDESVATFEDLAARLGGDDARPT
jgi:glutathione S-transferase